LPTGAHTPGTGEIHLTKKIGEGAFGVATHSWNVSTGEEYVIKEPFAEVAWKRGVIKKWKYEAHIMGLIKHVSMPLTLSCLF
jgi:serine/threonine protein kinase